MSKKFMPITCEKFSKKKRAVFETNCLAFALGICKKPKSRRERFELDKVLPIDIAFLNKVKELGLDPTMFRKISKEEEVTTKGFIIRVYPFAKVAFSNGKVQDDFHVIRREPCGLWVHKPGFGYPPRKVTLTDWLTIFDRYGNKFVSFAVDN